MLGHSHVLLVFPTDLNPLRDCLPPGISPAETDAWLTARVWLKRRPQIRHVFVPATRLDDFGLRYLLRLVTANASTPFSLFVDAPTFLNLDRSILAHEIGVSVIHARELEEKLEQLITCPAESLADYVRRAAGVQTEEAIALLDLLSKDPEALTLPARDLARRLGVGRTTLYRRIRDDGFAGVRPFQFLFKAVIAATMLQAGRSESEAAEASEYAEAGTLRRAVEDGLGLSTADLAREPGWRWIVERWIDRNRVEPSVSASS